MNLNRRIPHVLPTSLSVGYEEAFCKALRDKGYPNGRNIANTASSVWIDTPQGRRRAGDIVKETDEYIFVKYVIESKHLHRKLSAWAVDTSVLGKLIKDGVSKVRIVSDLGVTEEASVECFCKHGVNLDFGYGPQVFLARRYFAREDLRQGVLFDE